MGQYPRLLPQHNVVQVDWTMGPIGAFLTPLHLIESDVVAVKFVVQLFSIHEFFELILVVLLQLQQVGMAETVGEPSIHWGLARKHS